MNSYLNSAKKVIQIQAQVLSNLTHQLDDNFTKACQLIQQCSLEKGKVVLMGMGKSGHIAKKIAATFASTGTPAFFVHPSEAGHGDLGMIAPNDVVIAISYSGSSDEILMLTPLIRRLGVPLITLTGNPNSAMAKAGLHLDVSVAQEACPHNLAPTSSTTAALVMGDALAVSLLEAKGFSANDFARTHPSGALGRRLLTCVGDIMCSGDDLPKISGDMPLIQALLVMTQKTLGLVIMVDKTQQVLGVFTDGDLRRVLQQYDNIHTLNIHKVMQTNCKTIQATKPAILAVEIMETHKINALPVVDEDNKLIGAINTHSLLQAKII